MAIIKPGPALAGVNGSIGGSAVLRKVVNGVVFTSPPRRSRRTPGQSLAASRLAAASLQWDQLTDAQRTAWRTYSDRYYEDKAGEQPSRAPGRSLFIAQYAHALRAGQTPALNGPPALSGRQASLAANWDLVSNNSSARVRGLVEFFPAGSAQVFASAFADVRPKPTTRAYRSQGAYLGTWRADNHPTGIPSAGITFQLPTPCPTGGAVWITTRTWSADGRIGKQVRQLVEAIPPGLVLAFRMWSSLMGTTGLGFQILEGDELRLFEDIGKGPETTIIDLNPPGGRTIAQVRTLINATTPWAVLDANTALNARPAADIIGTGRRGASHYLNPVNVYAIA